MTQKQPRKPRPRHVWKTFIIPDGDEWSSLRSCWQSMPNPHRRKMYFERGQVETNLDLQSLRTLFRVANVKWRNYISDTKAVAEEPDDSDNDLPEGLRKK